LGTFIHLAFNLAKRADSLPLRWLLYLLGYCILNVTLTSEFVRKTQLESDVIAARQIQQTLQPANLASFPGYEVETFYKPFREMGGDYFDIIERFAAAVFVAEPRFGRNDLRKCRPQRSDCFHRRIAGLDCRRRSGTTLA
jgi:hypothetical protein